ncbi:MAG TPA: hypothetical protein VH681_02195, partial [Nitrospiraceae bacterium]
TLVETMVVVAIIGVLAAAAMLSYAHFIKKSQGVEADMALAEVTRLEEVYFSTTGTYSSDLTVIGFKPDPPLQFHTVSVQAVNGADGSMFQVTVNPLSGNGVGPSRSATRYSQGIERKVNDPAVAGGRTSTVVSAGNASGGQSVGGGEKDELSEQMSRSAGPSSTGGMVVDHGKASSLGTGNR